MTDDRGESISAMEPSLVQESSRFRTDELADLALDLTAKSTARRKSVPVGELVTLLQHMNPLYRV